MKAFEFQNEFSNNFIVSFFLSEDVKLSETVNFSEFGFIDARVVNSPYIKLIAFASCNFSASAAFIVLFYLIQKNFNNQRTRNVANK